MKQQPPTTVKLSIANNAALSGAFEMDPFVAGSVFVPDSWTDANIGFKVCDTSDGTFLIARDDTGSPIQISGINTTTGAAYKIPFDMFSHRFVKLWSKSTTAATVTDTNQSGAKALSVVLK